MLQVLLLVLGLIALVKGADWLVQGASSIARQKQISNMVIGLTIVSFGTSMPELVINLVSSFRGNTEIAIGNVVGSNIANILLILGISAMVFPLSIQRSTIVSEIPFSIIAALLMGFLANASLFMQEPLMQISRIDGLILIFFFILFLIYIFKISKEEFEGGMGATYTTRKSILMIIGGLVALTLGGKWTVDGAVYLAGFMGMSESFIGLTIVAVGTSLPELFTSAVAAYRREVDIAVGNVIGSNIFNLFWILGLSAIIKPLPFQVTGNMDILMIIFSSILIIIVLPFGKSSRIERWHGILFVLCYVVYVIYLVQRG
jgi:cation:H+ antiporter